MSAQSAVDPVGQYIAPQKDTRRNAFANGEVQMTASSTKTKKKKNKKKNAGAKGDANGDVAASNGAKDAADNEDDGDGEAEPETPVEPTSNAKDEDNNAAEGADLPVKVNGAAKDTSERLDALAKERDALREEVSGLRKSLEALTAKHEEDISGIKEQLEETQSGKEEAESKYEDLRERVTTIRTTLGERLKEYSVWILRHTHASIALLTFALRQRSPNSGRRSRTSNPTTPTLHLRTRSYNQKSHASPTSTPPKTKKSATSAAAPTSRSRTGSKSATS